MADVNAEYSKVKLIEVSVHTGVQEKECIMSVLGTGLQIFPSGHSLASSCGASWCQTVTLATEFSISTSHSCKIHVFSSYRTNIFQFQKQTENPMTIILTIRLRWPCFNFIALILTDCPSRIG